MYCALRGNERVFADFADRKDTYCCPACGKKVFLKRGGIKTAHFAHHKDCLCSDSWNYEMSKWHKDWQNLFPKGNREVTLSLTLNYYYYKCSSYEYKFAEDEYDFEDPYWIEPISHDEKHNIKLTHRADVLACGYVIEFQHSPISRREFNERNWFYQACGYKIIWIFDMREKLENGSIDCYNEWHRGKSRGGAYSWERASSFLSDYSPQKNKNIIVFFQFSDDEPDEIIMERLVWAIWDDDIEKSNFKRFYTRYSSYDATNGKKFFWQIKNKTLAA